MSEQYQSPTGVLGQDNRWLQVIIGFLISLTLGLLYAWSIFVVPLEKEFGWSRADTSLAFTISIIFFVVGMILGGKHTDKKGPRVVVSIGAACLTAGFFLASFTGNLVTLYISYGVLCGCCLAGCQPVPSPGDRKGWSSRRPTVAGGGPTGTGMNG